MDPKEHLDTQPSPAAPHEGSHEVSHHSSALPSPTQTTTTATVTLTMPSQRWMRTKRKRFTDSLHRTCHHCWIRGPQASHCWRVRPVRPTASATKIGMLLSRLLCIPMGLLARQSSHHQHQRGWMPLCRLAHRYPLWDWEDCQWCVCLDGGLDPSHPVSAHVRHSCNPHGSLQVTRRDQVRGLCHASGGRTREMIWAASEYSSSELVAMKISGGPLRAQRGSIHPGDLSYCTAMAVHRCNSSYTVSYGKISNGLQTYNFKNNM